MLQCKSDVAPPSDPMHESTHTTATRHAPRAPMVALARGLGAACRVSVARLRPAESDVRGRPSTRSETFGAVRQVRGGAEAPTNFQVDDLPCYAMPSTVCYICSTSSETRYVHECSCTMVSPFGFEKTYLLSPPGCEYFYYLTIKALFVYICNEKTLHSTLHAHKCRIAYVTGRKLP